jgi:hypothetical protein
MADDKQKPKSAMDIAAEKIAAESAAAEAAKVEAEKAAEPKSDKPKVTIHVLKPFRFSRLPAEGQKLTVEQTFEPGFHDIPEDMANHPWIKNDFADGRIERPEHMKARLETAAAAEDRVAKENAKTKELADAALARLTAASSDPTAREKIEKELNTPVNQLKKTGA